MRRYGRFVPQSTILRRVARKDARINRELQARLVAAIRNEGLCVPFTPGQDAEDHEDAVRAAYEDDFGGTRCGISCGYCGRCN